MEEVKIRTLRGIHNPAGLGKIKDQHKHLWRFMH